MVRSSLYAAIGFAAVSSIALAEELSGTRPSQVKEWFYIGPHIMVVLPDSAKDALQGINQESLQYQPYTTLYSSRSNHSDVESAAACCHN